MKKLFILLLISVYSFYTSAQQQFSFAKSASAAGFSAERLQRIDSFYNASLWLQQSGEAHSSKDNGHLSYCIANKIDNHHSFADAL